MKGFTLLELLVVLVLSSLAISLGYRLLTYSQKLFYKKSSQNLFIQHLIHFKSALMEESYQCKSIIEETYNEFSFNSDSSSCYLIINEKTVILKKGNRIDSINFSVNNLSKIYEPIQNYVFKDKLLREISFNIYYSQSNFPIRIMKNYTSFDKLTLENL